MTRPYEIFASPFPGVVKALVFPWPSGYSEREIFACRDALNSISLMRFDDGALLLAELPTFASWDGSRASMVVDWSAAKPVPLQTLGELFEAKTWSFSDHCQRRLVQLWLKDRAGWFTAKAGQSPKGLHSFDDRLLQQILLETSALCMGSTLEINTLVARNRQWSPAAVPYLQEVAADATGLRTRTQVLELSQMFGIDLPPRPDGMRYEAADRCFAQLERPHRNCEAIAAMVGCTATAIHHILRYRQEWAVGLTGLAKRVQEAAFRGLDAIERRSHWPRDVERLQRHIEATQRALGVADAGQVQEWQRWAYSGGVGPEEAIARLDEVLQARKNLNRHLRDAAFLGLLSSATESVVEEAMRSLGQAILARRPAAATETIRHLYNLAQLALLTEIADLFAKRSGTDAWGVVERNYRPLRKWSARSPSTDLRLRLLRTREAFEDWGAKGNNCLKAAGAVMTYLSNARMLFADEQASSPFSPVATLAMRSALTDLTQDGPSANCQGIVELQLVPQLRELSDPSRSRHWSSVELACAEIEAGGNAIWRSTDSCVSGWKETATRFGVAYNATSSNLSLGAHLPGAVRDLSGMGQPRGVADWQLQGAA